MNIDLIFGKIADFGATWVLWALLALSVAGLAVIVERAVCFWTTRDDIPSLSAELGRLIEDGTLTPTVDQAYPLAEAPAAMRRMEARRRTRSRVSSSSALNLLCRVVGNERR